MAVRNIDYASRIDNILGQTIPDLMSDSLVPTESKLREVNELYKLALSILPQQNKYNMEDINSYFENILTDVEINDGCKNCEVCTCDKK